VRFYGDVIDGNSRSIVLCPFKQYAPVSKVTATAHAIENVVVINDTETLWSKFAHLCCHSASALFDE
jgi:hypothetical protein